jgi:PIN domain nuclease of toxin-antitoxin system
VIVLDASAVLALLLKEPGHEIVAARLNGAMISSINFSEILARLGRDRIAPSIAAPRITELGITVVAFDEPQAIIAAEIREFARAAGLGLADCCCLALALSEQLPVLTADRIWKTLGLGLQIDLLR